MDKEYSSGPPIDLEAARLAIEWKAMFATELRTAARRLAADSERVTADHYRRALAPATARLLETIKLQSQDSPNVLRRTA